MIFLFLLLSVTPLTSLRGAGDEALLAEILDRRALSALAMTTGEKIAMMTGRHAMRMYAAPKDINLFYENSHSTKFHF